MDKNLQRITGTDRLSRHVDSDYLASGQLELDQDYLLTIDKLFAGKISTGGKAEQQIVISFKERTINGTEVKPMILNATNRRTLKMLYGDSANDLEGKPILIYVETGVRDPRTGGTTEGLRIRQRKPQVQQKTEEKCADCGKVIEAQGNFSPAQIIAVTRQRYGVALCTSCSAARKNATQAEAPAEQTAGEQS